MQHRPSRGEVVCLSRLCVWVGACVWMPVVSVFGAQDSLSILRSVIDLPSVTLEAKRRLMARVAQSVTACEDLSTVPVARLTRCLWAATACLGQGTPLLTLSRQAALVTSSSGQSTANMTTEHLMWCCVGDTCLHAPHRHRAGLQAVRAGARSPAAVRYHRAATAGRVHRQ